MRLDFFRLFQGLQGDVVVFLSPALAGGEGLRPHYNASHRDSVVLRRQPNPRSEKKKQSCLCFKKQRGCCRGAFFLLKCGGTNAALQHLPGFEGYAAFLCL